MPISTLPLALWQRFKNSPGLKKVIANASWLAAERVIRMCVGLLVSVLVARHLGPDQFGILSYASSIISFLGTFVYLGLSGIVVREIVRFPEDSNILLGTTFSMKFIGSFFAYCTVITIAFFSHGFGDNEFWVLVIVGLGLFAKPFDTIDFWFQSKIQSKYSVIVKSVAFLAAASGKILLTFLGASVIALSVITVAEIILCSILLVFIYHYTGNSINKWRANIEKAKRLFSQSWIIIFSGLLAMANLKVDQIMLRWMSGSEQVGIYSVAVTFSEVWYFIPEFIIISLYPGLIKLKTSNFQIYDVRIQQIFDLLFMIAFFVAIMMSLSAGRLIPLLYGQPFAGASSILVIHVWAGIFMFMRGLFSKWVLIEDALIFSLVSHGFGAVVNVFSNLLLIPSFGGQGAAVATLFSYATSSYFFLFCFKQTRPLAFKMTKSFLLPVRIILNREKIWA